MISESAERIYHHLRDYGAMPVSSVITNLHMTRRTVFRAMKELRDCQLVDRLQNQKAMAKDRKMRSVTLFAVREGTSLPSVPDPDRPVVVPRVPRTILPVREVRPEPVVQNPGFGRLFVFAPILR